MNSRKWDCGDWDCVPSSEIFEKFSPDSPTFCCISCALKQLLNLTVNKVTVEKCMSLTFVAMLLIDFIS